MNAINNRHDCLILFDVSMGNPNGDPDAGNMPRIDPNTSLGIVTDVCLKRKIRNYIAEVKVADADEAGNKPALPGYGIFVQQAAILNSLIKEGEKKGAEAYNSIPKDEAAVKWLCENFFDIRTFGAVLSTGNGVLRGSTYGQVRGPVQFTFGRSFHQITPLEISITRCAFTQEKEKDDEKKQGERTMGRKHVVPYALYAFKCYISPAFAERTDFTDQDLALFFEALSEMFTLDRSAARGEMIVRGIYDFEHVGTQHVNNAEQNRCEARLGCYHAHKLFEGIKVTLKDGVDSPVSFDDYVINCGWTPETLPRGVNLNLRHDLPMKTIKFGS